MTGESSLAIIVRVQIEQGESGLLFATSPDLKGLLVAERTKEDLEREIPNAIGALYEACGERICVIRAQDLDGDIPMKSWIKLPVDFDQRLECA